MCRVVALITARGMPDVGAGLEAGSWKLEAPLLHRYEAVEPHMGTLVKITVYTPGEEAARQAFRAGFDRIRELDAILSDYKTDSELNRLTARRGPHAGAVSRDLFAVLSAAQELADATSGAFDVTQGPVIRLWREARSSHRLPIAPALAEAAGAHRLSQAAPGCERGARSRSIRGDGARRRRHSPRATPRARRWPRSAALVFARRWSRSAATSRSATRRPGARLADRAARPARQRSGCSRVLDLTNAAVSTAGPAEQHLDASGRRYSHIVDPASRMGLTDDLTVTVIATTASPQTDSIPRSACSASNGDWR